MSTTSSCTSSPGGVFPATHCAAINQVSGVLSSFAQVVFTAGATAALKLVGEAFPWSASSSTCAYLTVNHNSALGIRQQAAAAGAVVKAVQPEQLQQQLRQQQQQRAPVVSDYQEQQQVTYRPQQQEGVYSLFVAPAECNMSGTRYDCVELFQHWQQQQQQQPAVQDHSPSPQPQQQQQQQQAQAQQQEQQWLLLVDAAKACGSHPPDCSGCDIDMLALSYYKIFGHPTGREQCARLCKQQQQRRGRLTILSLFRHGSG
jgi:molybdenum cofactor sulfurtransferase